MVTITSKDHRYRTDKQTMQHIVNVVGRVRFISPLHLLFWAMLILPVVQAHTTTMVRKWRRDETDLDTPHCYTPIETTMCPEFRMTPLAVGTVIGGVSVRTSADLDHGLQQLIQSNNMELPPMSFGKGCGYLSEEYRPRYLRTIMCKSIFSSESTLECIRYSTQAKELFSTVQEYVVHEANATQRNTTSNGSQLFNEKIWPQLQQFNNMNRPLCHSVCTAFKDSWLEMMHDQSVCPGSLAWISEKQSEIEAFCHSHYFSNSSACIDGIHNEPDMCGFSTPEKACEYCREHIQDPCCALVTDSIRDCMAMVSSNMKTITPSHILAFVLGCTIILLISLITFLCCMRRYHFRFQKRTKEDISEKRTSSDTTATDRGLYGHFSRSITQYYMNQIAQFTNKTTPMQPIDETGHLEEQTNVSPVDYQSELCHQQYYVSFAYEPVLNDEIQLNLGDVVTIYKVYDDGWARGYNANTNQYGMLPIGCLKPLENKKQWLRRPRRQNTIASGEHALSETSDKDTTLVHQESSMGYSFGSILSVDQTPKRKSSCHHAAGSTWQRRPKSRSSYLLDHHGKTDTDMIQASSLTLQSDQLGRSIKHSATADTEHTLVDKSSQQDLSQGWMFEPPPSSDDGKYV